MGINFQAMVETADDKYTKLVDMVCQLKNGSDVDYDRILNLINSIHNDEMELIVRMCEIEKERKTISKDGVQVFGFMTR